MDHIQLRIGEIQNRISEIQDRFGAPGKKASAFGDVMDSAARQASRPVQGGVGGAAVAGPYGPAIAEAAGHHQVDPQLVRAVMTAESGGNPQATSPVGAMGLMQLMPGTAQSLGVKNAYDPQQNLEGGAKYLAELTGKYGLEKGVAAYNAGPGAVEKHGGVPPYPETQHYVKKVLSLYNEFKGGTR